MYLQQVFKLLYKVNIILSLKKFFIKYLLVSFLRQRIDKFNLITTIKKIKIIL